MIKKECFFEKIHNKFFEIRNKIIWKLKKNEKKIIHILRAIIISWMTLLFLSGLFISYILLLNIFLYSMIIFLLFSLMYYAFIAIEEDRQKLMNIWKIYFAVISLMFIFIYTIEENTKKIEFEFNKTKLSYDIRLNSQKAEKTFEQYKNSIDKYLEFYKKKDIGYHKETKKEEKPYTIWYGNIAVTVMNIVTAFMFLWSLTELSFFKRKNKIDIKKKTNFLKY